MAETIFPYLTTVEGPKLAAQAFGKDVAKLDVLRLAEESGTKGKWQADSSVDHGEARPLRALAAGSRWRV